MTGALWLAALAGIVVASWLALLVVAALLLWLVTSAPALGALALLVLVCAALVGLVG